MFILNQDNNQLQKAKVCSFKELNLEERKHLQEWIANEPSSFLTLSLKKLPMLFCFNYQRLNYFV